MPQSEMLKQLVEAAERLLVCTDRWRTPGDKITVSKCYDAEDKLREIVAEAKEKLALEAQRHAESAWPSRTHDD